METPVPTLAQVLACLQKAGLIVAEKRAATPRALGRYTTDTRAIEGAGLFIAYRGVQFDAHTRVPELSRQYPDCVFIVEDKSCYDALPPEVQAWLVKDSREAWAYVAALRHGDPQEKLRMLGVTGTNGKTSTVWFVRQILRSMGIPCLTVGTLGVYCGEDMLPAHHTTPDPDELFKNLALAVARGIHWAAMEVSSHSIVQRRIGPIRFDAVAFTSFSRDHLDFHATMKEYFAAKWELFTRYRKKGAPGSISTTVAQHLPKVLPENVVFYGPKQAAPERKAYAYTIEDSRLVSTRLRLQTPRAELDLRFGFGGDFVMDNFTAALSLIDPFLKAMNFDAAKILPVPGRFEPVPAAAKKGLAVIVDYAHTPDALEKTLLKLKEMTDGRLWVVFGCGGDRDNGKRPLMGAIAQRLADEIVVTSDNPRTENPRAIIDQILAGLNGDLKKPLHVYEDRKEAIRFACSRAATGDSILIAGKGHEDYQIIGTTKYPFDDRLIAGETFA